MNITSVIRLGIHCGPQIVVVNSDMVAKIYHPLYYQHINDFGYPNDVVTEADSDYSREVAAYQELQKSELAQEITSTFHGA